MRDLRNKQNLKPKENVRIFILSENEQQYSPIMHLLQKQLYASDISFVQVPVKDALVLAIENDRFFIETENEIQNESQKEGLEKDLAHQKNFLAAVLKKLSNEKFIQNAKAEVIALEQKKRDDTEARIQAIEESLKLL